MVVALAAVMTVAVACGSDDGPGAQPTSTPDTSTPTPIPTPAGGPGTPVPTPTQTPTPTPVPHSELQAKLNAAREKWDSSAPFEYEFELRWSCYCPYSGTPTLIKVEGERIVSATDPISGAPIAEDERGKQLTIDELFDWIQMALNLDGGEVVELSFERDFGYPISGSVDWVVGALDDEIGFSVANLREDPGTVDLDQLRRSTDEAMFRWFDNGPQSYEFVFRWLCFCPPPANTPTRVRVEGGQIVSTVDARTGEPVTALGGLEYQTVPELFQWIREQLNRNPDSVQLEFDRETGYPIEASFDPIRLAVDDEIAFFIDEFEVVDTHVELQSELDAARARWDASAPANYSYRFNWLCFCLDEYTAQMTVTAQNGIVTSVIRVEDGEPVSAEFEDSFDTVDELFDRVQKAIDQGAASIRAEFDPVSGLPTEVFIDENYQIADEELGWNAGEVISLG